MEARGDAVRALGQRERTIQPDLPRLRENRRDDGRALAVSTSRSARAAEILRHAPAP